MDVLRGGIDIGDHGFYGRIGVRHQSGLIASHWLKAIHRVPNLKEMGVVRRYVRLNGLCPGVRNCGHIRQQRQNFVHDGHAAAADVRFTEEEIGRDAKNRKCCHDDHPREPRRRVPMTPQKGARHEDKLKQPEQERPRRRQELTFSHPNGVVLVR